MMIGSLRNHEQLCCAGELLEAPAILTLNNFTSLPKQHCTQNFALLSSWHLQKFQLDFLLH